MHIQLHIGSNDCPLLISNPQTVADPRGPLAREIRDLAAKRGRTDEEEERLQRLKFNAALYRDKEGLFLPSNCLFRSIQNAARLSKLGKHVERGLVMGDQRLRLTGFSAPADLDKLFDNKDFVHYDTGVVAGRRIPIVRPQFLPWEISTTLLLDTEHLDYTDLVRIIEEAGRHQGIGTYRQLYGRYEVFNIKEQRLAA